MFRNRLIALLIWLIEKELSTVPRETLSEEQVNGLFATLWDNPAFRNYISERNAKLVYTIAGYPGNEPEPRDKFHQKYGQRVENLILGSKAKLAAAKRDNVRELKKKEAIKQNNIYY
jgi:hypothetical protein